MPIDVSVVIPFFNPGADLDDCIDSLLAQTMPPDRFEVVLVDDGSTDGSGARVDDWVARHPGRLNVLHIAATGGPARPRNLGVDKARGRYVQFVDSDDTMAPSALERLVEIADASAADVVVSKISSGGPRGIHHPLFRRTVTGLTLADDPGLVHNGTVCKMFRRDFLRTHDIRFPEGPTYIEDQNLCLRAYANATSIAVAADLVYYFHQRRRTGGEHFGNVVVDPDEYRSELTALFDLVDTEVTTAAAQRAAASRYYRNEMLGRLRGPAMLMYDDDYRRDLTAMLRELAMSRLPDGVIEGLPALQRAQSSLLLVGDYDGLTAISRALEALRLEATAGPPRWRDGVLVVTVSARFMLDDEPLRLEGDGRGWALPSSLLPGVLLDDRRLTAVDEDELDLDLAAVSVLDGALWSTTEGLALDVEADGTAHINGDVVIDPQRVMAGAPLSPGTWDLRLRVIVAGISRSSRVRPIDEAVTDGESWLTTSDGQLHSVTPIWDGPRPGLSLDVDEWSRQLQERIDFGERDSLRLESSRELTIPASRLRGSVTTTAAGTVILEPLGATAAGTVAIAADIVASPEGSAVRATIPALPTAIERWAVWLRIGAIGTATPRRLAIELRPGRFGKLRLERT